MNVFPGTMLQKEHVAVVGVRVGLPCSEGQSMGSHFHPSCFKRW